MAYGVIAFTRDLGDIIKKRNYCVLAGVRCDVIQNYVEVLGSCFRRVFAS